MVDIMSSQEESGYQLQADQVNLKEMKDGVGLNFYLEMNTTEQINCERMEINVEGILLVWQAELENISVSTREIFQL